MSDFSVRSDSVDVEQIMRQIRARIRDKRGVDYTEEQIRELATANLERFLDPGGVRSGLLADFRARLAAEPPPMYAFEDTTLFESDKAIVRFIRRLLKPVLKLFFNYNVLSHTLHTQAEYNHQLQQREPLYFEVIHNLVVELTRISIESKNLKMRLESVQSRLEFNERRARALEAVVQYKDAATPGREDRQDRRPDERRSRDRHDGPRDRQDRPERQERSDRQERQDRQPPPRPQVQQAQPAPAPAAPQAAPLAQAGQGGEADPNTEPQGGVDPITGGESLRTRRRRRRRGRRGQGHLGAGAQPTEGAMDDGVDAGGDDNGEIDAAEAGEPTSAPAATSAPAPMERTEAAAAFTPAPAPPAPTPAPEARRDVDAATTEHPAPDRREDGGPSDPGQQ